MKNRLLLSRRVHPVAWALLLVALLLTGLPCAGASNVGKPYRMCVWLKSGEKDCYLFSDKPELRLVGDVLRLQSNSQSVDIPKSDFDKITLEQVQSGEPTGITMPESLLLGFRRTAQLSYTLQPANAVTTVTWLNFSNEVVGLSGNGLLTGLQPGTSLVRVQTSNGLRAACQVTVPVPRYRLIVWLRDGSVADTHSFAHKPTVTIDGDVFIVSSKRTMVSYPAANILKFTLDDAALLTGDVNLDGQVGIGDIVAVTNVMAGEVVESGYVLRSDVNGDGEVGIGDIVAVTNIMAGQ